MGTVSKLGISANREGDVESRPQGTAGGSRTGSRGEEVERRETRKQRKAIEKVMST